MSFFPQFQTPLHFILLSYLKLSKTPLTKSFFYKAYFSYIKRKKNTIICAYKTIYLLRIKALTCLVNSKLSVANSFLRPT